MSEVFEEILRKRGFEKSFLRPEYTEVVGGYQGELPDLERAVERIREAVQRQEKVLVYGDYDVDGVTASTLMCEALKLGGLGNVEVMLPDRFVDGYGMSERAVERARELGAKLVVTVDCGSNNSVVIDELTEAGIDTIVTDHHEIMGELPKAVAVVNPKREGGELAKLAGVGVAFMVAKALVEAGMIPRGQEKWMLDLVLIGTICDSMELTGVNRELCYYGMIVLPKTRRVGLRELMKKIEMERVTAHAIGFGIGPRLNAGGRMESAEISLRLLRSESKTEAIALATELDELNKKRRAEQMRALEEIEKRDGVKAWMDGEVIVVQGVWHEGVVGIIAGRIVEKYHKPAFVLTKVRDKDVDGDGMVDERQVILKGSGRTFGDFNLAEALKYCQGEIIGGGGHAGACGLTVAQGSLEDFAEKVNQYYRELGLTNQERFLKVKEDVEVKSLDKVDVELIDEIEQLEPFGEGNREPIVKLPQMFVLNTRLMGAERKHVRVDIRGDDGKVMKLVAFNAPEEWKAISAGERRDFWVKLEKNTWNGRTEPQGMVVAVA